jgi:hypothetical protein
MHHRILFCQFVVFAEVSSLLYRAHRPRPAVRSELPLVHVRVCPGALFLILGVSLLASQIISVVFSSCFVQFSVLGSIQQACFANLENHPVGCLPACLYEYF